MVDRLNKIIRKRDLPEFVGLQRTQIEQMVEAGEFPRPIHLNKSGRAIGWVEREVFEWQQSRLAARDAAKK